MRTPAKKRGSLPNHSLGNSIIMAKKQSFHHPIDYHEAMKRLEQTSAGVPLVAIDLLDTFYDENISDSESLRLVTLAIRHLRRLGQTAPLLITFRPPALPSRIGLIKLMRGAARQVYEFESPFFNRKCSNTKYTS